LEVGKSALKAGAALTISAQAALSATESALRPGPNMRIDMGSFLAALVGSGLFLARVEGERDTSNDARITRSVVCERVVRHIECVVRHMT
jgi:hypothetical protein